MQSRAAGLPRDPTVRSVRSPVDVARGSLALIVFIVSLEGQIRAAACMGLGSWTEVISRIQYSMI